MTQLNIDDSIYCVNKTGRNHVTVKEFKIARMTEKRFFLKHPGSERELPIQVGKETLEEVGGQHRKLMTEIPEWAAERIKAQEELNEFYGLLEAFTHKTRHNRDVTDEMREIVAVLKKHKDQ